VSNTPNVLQGTPALS